MYTIFIEDFVDPYRFSGSRDANRVIHIFNTFALRIKFASFMAGRSSIDKGRSEIAVWGNGECTIIQV